MFSWHLPYPDSSVGLPDGEAGIHHSRESFSTASPIAASFTPLQPTLGIVHGDQRLACGYPAMVTLHPEAVWNLGVSVATIL